MENLTSRQSEVLASIRNYIERHGFPPTIAELTTLLGIRSPNAVRDHLRTLARKGVIALTPAASRGIRLLTAPNNASADLPIVGRVAAGSPILAEQHIEAHHQIDATLFQPRANYLLRVHGTSMQNAGILDGDLLAVHQTQQAENGQIIVARIDNEVTVKRFKRTDYLVHLLPENDDFDPIEIDLRHEQLTIEGLGVGVVRSQIN